MKPLRFIQTSKTFAQFYFNPNLKKPKMKQKRVCRNKVYQGQTKTGKL